MLDKRQKMRYNEDVNHPPKPEGSSSSKTNMNNHRIRGCLQSFAIPAVLFAGVLWMLSRMPAIAEGTDRSLPRTQTIQLTLPDTLSAQSEPWISEEQSAAFPVNGIGLKWTGDQEITFEVRVSRDRSTWSTWIPFLNTDQDGKPTVVAPGLHSTQPIFFEPITTFQLRATPGSRVSRIDVMLFDTITGAVEHHVRGAQVSTPGKPTVISRAEWGADEALRKNINGEELWPSQPADVHMLLVHHTAGSDGGIDPAATIRGIYYWHAQVLGWGDIGYNYLIDPQGRIYEGRAGGEGVVGGHTYDSNTNLNFNTVSAGIAVLGCFEALQSGCPTPHTATSTAEESLTNLLAYLSAQYHLDPTGTATVFEKAFPVISGHRDADLTLCPGSNLYDRLDEVRINVASRLQALGGGTPELRATLIGHTVIPAGFANAKQQVTLQFRNTGTQTWEHDWLRLKITNSDETQRSAYADGSWTYDFGEFQSEESMIPSGEVATFTFSWTLPKTPGRYEHKLHLRAWDRVIEDSTTAFQTRTDSMYRAELIEQNIPVAIRLGWRPTVTIRIKNTGLATWGRNITLQFGDQVWTMQETRIQPGEIATFQSKYRPKSVGVVRHVFFLTIPSRADLVFDGGPWERLMRVD
jgi:hypothetical protein